jgi:hypothetical protein
LKTAALPLLILLTPTLGFADEVYLKGAGSISGRITERTATMILVDNGDGVRGWQVSPFDGDVTPAPLPAEVLTEASEQAELNPPLADARFELAPPASQ